VKRAKETNIRNIDDLGKIILVRRPVAASDQSSLFQGRKWELSRLTFYSDHSVSAADGMVYVLS